MANVELGSSNLKEVYDAINANSGSSVDTTNLAKLNEANTFTALNTFNTLPQSNGTPANDTDLVTKAYVDSVAGDGDTSNFAKLDAKNTFTYDNVFNRDVYINRDVNISGSLISRGLVNLGGATFQMGVTFFGENVFKGSNSFREGLKIMALASHNKIDIFSDNGGTISMGLGYGGVLDLDARMISELKRLLGIS